MLSLPGLLRDVNQWYDVRSFFITKTYFVSGSRVRPMSKTSMCTTSVGCCPCTAVAGGRGKTFKSCNDDALYALLYELYDIFCVSVSVNFLSKDVLRDIFFSLLVFLQYSAIKIFNLTSSFPFSFQIFLVFAVAHQHFSQSLPVGHTCNVYLLTSLLLLLLFLC